MQIIKSTQYLKKLQIIMEYIAKDNLSRALKFRKSLDDEIDNNIINMPFKYRKSI